jgi:DNA-binding CsgD family transcriptional regulator
MPSPPRTPEGHRRTVFGPSVDAVQRELIPALNAGVLPADREAGVRAALGRLLMEFGDWDAGLEQLELAVDQLPDPSVARAVTLLWLGWPYGSSRPASWHLAQVHRAAAAAPADLADADRLMLDRLYVTRLLFGGDPDGWRHLGRIPDDAETQEVAIQALLAHVDLTYAAVLWGHYDQADHHARIAGQLSSRWYFEGFTDALASTTVELDWCQGRWDGLSDRALALTTTGHDRFARLESVLVSTRLAAACGLPSRPGTDPERVLAEMLPHEAPELLAQAASEAARRHLRRGDVAAAVDVTDAAAVEVLASRNWLSAVDIVPVRLEVLVAASRVTDAEVLLRELESLVPHPTPARAAATLALCRGLLLEAHQPARAADHLAEATQRLTALPRPYDAALVRARRARCLAGADARSEAVVELKTARVSFVDLCAWTDVSDVEAQLRRLGVRGTGWPGRRPYGDQLSPRERDVVALVAQGHTNRQISQALGLSAKTVANHVASARRKLRAPSRTALAVQAIATGLIEHPVEQPPEPRIT